MRLEVRRWGLHLRSDLDLEEIIGGLPHLGKNRDVPRGDLLTRLLPST